METWFVAVEKIKEDLVASNQQIHWSPGHLKMGRFGKWLENARDWNISRNRYWGTPLPIWRAADGELAVIGSVAELEEYTQSKITDLHRHYIDHLTFTKNGKEFKRVPEVFDCWFESGSMPYAQNHYPFENRELFAQGFPADFIGEGLDQTRGWFYTLTVLSSALFKKPAFKNVIVNGIVLAEDGAKMSKRLRNYPDPNLVIQKYGADAVRLYMMHSPVVQADDLRFTENGVELVLRQILIPFWNAFSFLTTYAKIYAWTPDRPSFEKPDAIIDRWILSMLQKLIHDVEEGMKEYDLSQAVEPLVGFVDQLTNWYIRRCRRRFWEDQDTPDRRQAFETLYTVLLTLSKAAAPFVPFICEAIYSHLRTPQMPESVHLCDYPEYISEWRDENLEAETAAVQATVSLGHALRKEHKLKVRQPLSVATIVSADDRILNFLQDQKHLIAEELNVKDVRLSNKEENLVFLQGKPNFRLLGKKVGKKMPAVQAAIAVLPQEQLSLLMDGESISLKVDGESIVLAPEEIQVERVVQDGMIASNQGAITIALDTALNDELRREGLMRELVNKINTMRREADFHVTDRIDIRMETTDAVRQCFEHYKEYIQNEVLAVDVEFGPCEGMEWDLNGEPAKIVLERKERLQ
jgi:isoleucyl-tRNA synthetase